MHCYFGDRDVPIAKIAMCSRQGGWVRGVLNQSSLRKTILVEWGMHFSHTRTVNTFFRMLQSSTH